MTSGETGKREAQKPATRRAAPADAAATLPEAMTGSVRAVPSGDTGGNGQVDAWRGTQIHR